MVLNVLDALRGTPPPLFVHPPHYVRTPEGSRGLRESGSQPLRAGIFLLLTPTFFNGAYSLRSCVLTYGSSSASSAYGFVRRTVFKT